MSPRLKPSHFNTNVRPNPHNTAQHSFTRAY